MKAKKILLSNYEVDAFNEKGETVKIAYDVKRSLADILLAPQLKLNGFMLLRNNILAQKIVASEDSIFLDDNEFSLIRHAVEAIEGFSKNDVELMKRILQAEEVEMEEKK